MSDPSRTVLAVDLGGTNLRVALLGPDGGIRVARRVATDRAGGPQGVIGQILELAGGLRAPSTRTIGIAVPGAFEAETGVVLGIPALPGWTGVALRDAVESRLGCACLIENDATAACIGEWRAGAGRGCRHLVYITLSTGIGAGVVIDGRVLRGVRGLAGEIGHTRIATESAICSCGNVGCWEAVASGTALGRAGAAEAAAHPRGAIARRAGGVQVAAAHVGEAARAGDPAALGLLREEARWLGEGFANAQHLYAPERIVVGGGISALLDLMHGDISRALRQRLLPGFPEADIAAAALGDDAGLVGVGLEALEAE